MHEHGGAPGPAGPVVVTALRDDRSIAEQIETALRMGGSALDTLPVLTNVAIGDPYLAAQLVALHHSWEIRPVPARSLLGRLRSRLAWWLAGPELRQVNATHATLVRLVDSLIVQLDADRAARRRLEEQLAYRAEQA